MNVVVLVLRGCSAGRLGAYGNEWIATPNLDRLAAEGIVFDRHFADRPESDLVGRVRDAGIPAAVVPLEDLRSPAAGMVVVEVGTLLPPWNVPADLLAAYAEELELPLDTVPNFALVPFDPAGWDALHASFAAVLTRLDARLGEALDRLADAAVVVTADAGFPLGEHGFIGPRRPHEELVHLPLIVRLPNRAFAGTRVPAFTQPADLPPTLLALLDRPIPPGLDGHDLSPLWAGGPAVRPHAVTLMASGEAAIRTDAWTCLLPGDATQEPQLYVRPDDRHEVNDLAARRPDVVEELTAQARAAASRPDPAT